MEVALDKQKSESKGRENELREMVQEVEQWKKLQISEVDEHKKTIMEERMRLENVLLLSQQSEKSTLGSTSQAKK